MVRLARTLDSAKANRAKLLRAYREIESGKRSDRTEQSKSIVHATRSSARLVIAILDRLARNLYVLSGLMESGVDFVTCGNRHANRLTIHILAAVAEDEALRISERTWAALAAFKARGRPLRAARSDGRRVNREAAQWSRERDERGRRENADAALANLTPMLADLRAEGRSLQGDRRPTERRGPPHPPSGGLEHKAQVKRVLDRLEGRWRPSTGHEADRQEQQTDRRTTSKSRT
ncbi:recombinase family protein [Tautonia marina]|uniref:recombinase family protein n=1 Tax=Tautonia marina TaxID=2653855 RepID=UPI001260A04E|nr:recombinase family protein [Tautonia marina]